MSQFEVMKACDFDPDCWKNGEMLIGMPKVDGVRGTNAGRGLVARSGDPHANKHVTELFSHATLYGLDGELVAESITHPDLCRLTTSALNTVKTTPFVQWWVFDCNDKAVQGAPYERRLRQAKYKVEQAIIECPWLAHHLRLMPWEYLRTMDHLTEMTDRHKAEGYEGSIVRDRGGLYKHGRATARELSYGRIKAWAHDEIYIDSIEEGRSNCNELQKDANGYAKRSTHLENMVPNGMVGAFIGRLIKDVVVNGGKKVIPHNTQVRVSAGRIPHDLRKQWFENPALCLGEIMKFQHFPHGVKDTLRFPTAITLRPLSDL